MGLTVSIAVSVVFAVGIDLDSLPDCFAFFAAFSDSVGLSNNIAAIMHITATTTSKKPTGEENNALKAMHASTIPKKFLNPLVILSILPTNFNLPRHFITLQFPTQL